MRRVLVLALLASSTICLANPVLRPASLLVQEPALQQQGTDEAALYKIGGDVHAPVLLKSVAPRYPRSWFGKDAPSVVVVGLVVTETGQPNNLHIVRSGGDKFDKNAIDAVKKYRFQPATKAGQPVPVQLNVEVRYQIY